MKKNLFLITVVLLGLQTFAQLSYMPDEVIVQLNYKQSIERVVNETNKQYPGIQLRIKKNLSKRINIWLLEFDDAVIKVGDLEDELNRNTSVAIAQVNHTNIVLRNIPNDPLFSSQWDMLNDGNNGSVVDADIDADEAWDIATGGLTVNCDTIVVAVIDGGFDLNHEDLDFWENRFEIPNNNIDDDNNGFIDDIRGWNAYNGNDDVMFSGAWDSHGTHVSGTVGAIGNNGKGLVGVNWNVKVMAISGSSGDEATVVEAYSFALEHRAKYNETNGDSGAYVVSTNSSFGVDFGQPADYPLWCAFYDSLGAYGIVSAGATINGNTNVDVDGDVPTACASDYMISVTNTNSSDQKVSSAGYGATTIDIGAPGNQIWSTVPNDDYQGSSWTGTSMATPHVAGAIGLMYSAACKEMLNDFADDPAGLALQMRNYMLQSGFDSIASLQGITVTGGRLNLHKCLLAVQSYNNCTTFTSNCFPSSFKEFVGQKQAISVIYPNPASNWAQIEYELPSDAHLQIEISNALGQVVKTIDQENVFAGINRHKIDLTGLGSGVYFLNLKEGEKRSATVKLMVYE
ncbi:MAG: hypothetical protein COA57_02305 [Flavobacteriales bacterium]|nr:S8 family peptidase [Bacteroidales bacterium AH-315-I05]PCJ89347.1 MAG: hypothetical protein COA57_02305 [Flavobacteriales bacterium]